MSTPPDPHPAAESEHQRGAARSVLGFLTYLLLLPLVLFGTAGTIHWWQGWAWIALAITAGLGSRILVGRRHPDLLHERARHREHQNVAPGDRWFVAVIALFGPLATLIFAALDQRYFWTASFLANNSARGLPSTWPAWWSVAGLLIAGGGVALGTRAMLENRNFSAVVRIQDDRGHEVCDTGPYRFIRHPGYTGGLLSTAASPFALGSLAAFLPAAIVLFALVWRTAREDRYLSKNLAGYEAFTSRTRSRLIPGIW